MSYLLTKKISLTDCIHFLRYRAISVIVCVPVYDVINFEIKLSYQAIFLHDRESQDKNLNILRTKSAFKMKTHFSSVLKSFRLPEIVSNQRLRLYAVNYFPKKVPSSIFESVANTPMQRLITLLQWLYC